MEENPTTLAQRTYGMPVKRSSALLFLGSMRFVLMNDIATDFCEPHATSVSMS